MTTSDPNPEIPATGLARAASSLNNAPAPWLPEGYENGVFITDENKARPGEFHVAIYREPFSDYAVVIQDDNHSEELEYEELRKWLVDRGANRLKVERSILDVVWNEPRVLDVYIQNPKEPPVVKTVRSKVTPKI